MPFARNSELPSGVKNALPAAAQTIFRRVANAALASGDSDESAFRQAWSVVKQSYKKVGDHWIAKEAEMPESGIQEKLSAEDKQSLLHAALNEKFPPDTQTYPFSPSPWIRDVYDTEVVYEIGGTAFQVSYTMTEEGKVELGDDTQRVFAQTTYKPIEALREAYAELIQEAGERGVPADAIQQASASCSAVIDAEEPDEESVESALKAAEGALEWLKLQEATKTEAGVSFPSAAYAYVPDADKPSTWKLRLWEDLEKKATVAQVGRAAAALSPGGFRGNRVQLPADAIAGVKAKIRAAYRRLGVKAADMPRWVKEAEMRDKIAESCEIDIQEVTKEGIAKGIVPVRIIMPGFNYDESRYYSEQSVQDAAELFGGAKMYADHATKAEEQVKPERSIRDWVATLHETKVSDAGNAVGVAHINAGWLKEKISALFEQGDLEHLGTSINAVGKGTKQTIEGKKTVLIEGIVKSTFQSVDFVTEAGAGGQAGLRESVREDSVDIDLMDLAELREARPDLVTDIEMEAKESLRQEVKEAMEATTELEGLKGQVETLTTERDGLQAKIDEAETARLKAEAQAAIKEAVGKADLPDAAKTKLLARFADAESDDGVEDAIKAEADYIATLLEAGKVKGLGPKHEDGDPEASKAKLRESVKRMHPEYTDQQVEDFITGR